MCSFGSFQIEKGCDEICIPLDSIQCSNIWSTQALSSFAKSSGKVLLCKWCTPGVMGRMNATSSGFLDGWLYMHIKAIIFFNLISSHPKKKKACFSSPRILKRQMTTPALPKFYSSPPQGSCQCSARCTAAWSRG